MAPPTTPPAQVATGRAKTPTAPRSSRIRPQDPNPPSLGIQPVNRVLFPTSVHGIALPFPFGLQAAGPGNPFGGPLAGPQPAPPPLPAAFLALLRPPPTTANPLPAVPVPVATQQSSTTAAATPSTTSLPAPATQDGGSAAPAQSSRTVLGPRQRADSDSAIEGESAATKRRRKSR